MLILSDDVRNKRFPLVNCLLIVANVAVFCWMLANNLFTHEFSEQWGTVPSRFVAHPGLDQFGIIVSAMFIHAGFAHIIGNMWVLWLFGDNVEDRLGHWTYLFFYLTCGVFADVLYILSSPSSVVPCVGASGAIAGVMGAYMVLHPDARCKTWWGDDLILFAFRTYYVPATLVICGWFALQALLASLAPGSQVAYFAHIGGFLAGVGLLSILRYRDYETDEIINYPGAFPAICAIAFIGLGWWLVSPQAQAFHYSKPTAVTKPAPVVATTPRRHTTNDASKHATQPKHKHAAAHKLGSAKGSTR